jgi:4-hydroxy-tetrahydrodipicolinate synthase
MIGTETNPFGRLVTSMVTPFNKELNVDFPAVERLVNHILGTGTDTIVVCATVGESPTLEESELFDMLKHVVSITRGRAKVIMGGASSNSTKKAVKLSQAAEKSGADGLLSVVPYYNKPGQAGIIEHFSTIAKSTSLPIMLYNIPGRTGVNMTAETTVQLAQSSPTIIAIKDCFGNTEQAAEIARLAPKNFRIYTGDDHLILPFLAIGACGVVSTAGNVVGASIKQMMELFLKGDLNKSKELYFRYLPLFKGLFAAPNPTCLKYALAKQGLCSPYLRPPLVPLDEQQKAAFEKVLEISPLDALDVKVSVSVS